MTFDWLTVGYLLDLAIRVAVILYILARRRSSPTVTLAWIVVIFALPVLGTVAYLLFGEIRLGRSRLRQHKEVVRRLASSHTTPAELMILDPPDLPRNLQHLATLGEVVGGNGPRGGNALDLIGATDEVITRLIADIDAAKDHCHLLFYIYLNDHSGLAVAHALQRAAQRGVCCRVLVDAVGSDAFLDSTLRQEMEAAGVQVAATLPVNPLRMMLARIDLRNHRKIVVIDNAIGYLGSQNIADAAFALKARYAPWVDCMVRMRGPAVRDLQMIFVEDWYLDTEESIEDLLDDVPAPETEGMIVQVMGTGPNSYNEALRQLVSVALHLAREELIITTPYFVPDESTLSALVTAARRGVDTTLLLPARNDSPLVAAASRSSYHTLLEAGVNVWEYQAGLLHAKTLTIDRDLALVSSANMDRRSFELNFEVSMLVYDTDFASELRFLQKSYLNDAMQIELGRWDRRALHRRLWQNAVGVLTPLL